MGAVGGKRGHARRALWITPVAWTRLGTLVGVVTLLVIGGWAASGSSGAQAPDCLPTADRTVGPHGLRGLRVKRTAPVYTDALDFARKAWNLRPRAARRKARLLNGEGFVSGISQHYVGKRGKTTRGDEGLSWALQLGSPEQAQVRFERQVPHAAFWKRFTVPAIPGSKGVRDEGDRSGASNVLFTDDVYVYLVGRFESRGGSRARQTTNAAITLYNRVHGAPVCPE